METTIYSKETKTVIGLFECLPETKRKQILEKVQELIVEQESESNWEHLFEKSSESMIDMAKNALLQHKNGQSKRLKI